MDRHRIAFVIPALNESSTIQRVVTGVARYGTPVVVDDGSTDGTGDIASASGAIVLRHPANCGYDAALNSGFHRASELAVDWLVSLDADGQHDPATIPLFLNEFRSDVDLVLGVRDRRQRVAESVFAIWTRVRWGITDPLCGMKAYRLGLYQSLGHFDSYGSVGTELMLFAMRQGASFRQVSVSTRDRSGEPRFGRRIDANVRILGALARGIVARG